jgi:hypothetical protein
MQVRTTNGGMSSLGPEIDDLIFAPEEDGDVEVVYPGLLSLRELELVEAEQVGHMPTGDQPPIDRLGDLLLGVADPVYQWPTADELVHGRDERWGRRRGIGGCLFGLPVRFGSWKQ